MIEITKQAAEAFKEVVSGPEANARKVRITFDAGG